MRRLILFGLLICSVPLAAQYGQNKQYDGTVQVSQFPGADLSAKLNACISASSSIYGGICDARSFGPSVLLGNITVSTANVRVLLPCATIQTAHQVIVSAGVRNTYIEGCAFQGGSASSGTQGGTVWVYTGSGNAFQVGDPTYAVDTKGFRMSNVNLNTNGAGSSAQGIYFYRAQEVQLDGLYLNGNNSTGQTGVTLDGTGNYSGGTFTDVVTDGFGAAWYLTGHLSGSVVDDYANASTFVKLHIDCPTSSGSPISGTYGVNIAGGDGNTFSGGDIEGCSTAVHFGAAATSNVFTGLRNENSTMQIVADAHSTYNNVIPATTLFQGKVSDAGSQNSFQDAFHRSFNGINGDWYASLLDTTLTDHERLGIGLGNERGRISEIQTDYGYRWQIGFGDGTTGEQVWSLTDMLANVQRIGVGQYLSATADVVTNVVMNSGGCYSSSTPPTLGFSGGGGASAAGTPVMYASSCSGGWSVLSVTMTNNGSGYTSQPTLAWSGSNQLTAPNAVAEIATTGSANNQTVLNSTGSGAVVLNGSANSGTGGVVIAGGGSSPTQVAAIDSSGNTTLSGQLNFQAAGTNQWSFECNSATVCALHNGGATIPANVFRAFPNAGTEIDSQGTSGVVINNTSTGGTGGMTIYEGGSNYTVAIAKFLTSGTIGFPGLAASSGHNCLQVDTSGYMTNTGSACGTGSGSGTVNSGSAYSPAYYPSGGGTQVSGVTPFAGLAWWSASAPPQQATSSNVQSVIGSGVYDASGAAAAAVAGSMGGNAATATKLAANTLGCLDGWDHLPCTVYIETAVSESSPTASYATVWTSSAAGIYRVSGYIYGTTASSTSYSVEQFVKAQQSGQSAGNGYLLSEAQVGTSISSDPWYSYVFPLGASIPVQTETVTASGTNTSGVWTRGITIERLQ